MNTNTPFGVESAAASPARSEAQTIIGFSVLGRPLVVHFAGGESAPLRVLLLCGQHGDERAIRRATQEFFGRCVSGHALPEGVQVAALLDANPDGFALGSRTNANGIDLNRDHLLLQAPETVALHRFVESWRPHLVLDLHNYPARRLHLVQKQMRLGWDLCIDFPTHPATGFGAGHPFGDALFHAMDEALGVEGYPFGRYCIVREGRAVRHGTPELVDARNVLTLRHQALTLLLEARNPQQGDAGSVRRAVRRAVSLACEAILSFAAANAGAIRDICSALAETSSVPLRWRRTRSTEGIQVPVVELHSGARGTVPMAEYQPTVEGRRHRKLPFAYAVPLGETALLAALARQRFQACAADAECQVLVEETRIPHDASTPTQVRRSRFHQVVHYPRSLQGFALFPARQPGARCLALMLEAASRSAIHRLPGFTGMLSAGGIYPVRRVLETCGPLGCDAYTEELG